MCKIFKSNPITVGWICPCEECKKEKRMKYRLDQLELCNNPECVDGKALQRIEGILTTEVVNCPYCEGRGFILKGSGYRPSEKK